VELPKIKSVRKYHDDTCSDAYNFVKRQEEYCYWVIFEDNRFNWTGNAKDRQEAIDKAIEERIRDDRQWTEVLKKNENIIHPKMTTLELMYGDKCFKEHPEKILGEEYETTGQWGVIKKYRGERTEALAKIGIPPKRIFRPNVNIAVTTSVIDTDNAQPTVTEEEAIIQEVPITNTDIKITKRKKKEEKKQDPTDPEPPKEYFGFKETFEQTNRINLALPSVDQRTGMPNNNAKISYQELRAYVWYMEQTDRKMSQKWYDLAGFRTNTADNEVNIKQWMQDGVVFYYKGEHLPAYAYVSGNMYDKKAALNDDREAIVTLYGEEIFDAQKKNLDDIFTKTVYNTRLQINPVKSGLQLVILPNSDFAREFKISTLDEESKTSFRVYQHTDTVENRKKERVGETDFVKKKGSTTRVEELSLRDAFQFWMEQWGGGNKLIKKANLTHNDIFLYYLEGARYSESRDGTYENFNRKKAQSKEEGDRLFMHFLKNLVTPEDQLKIEMLWNRENNAIIEANFDKIPVAFEYGKDFYGSKMDIRWEKREAVAFMASQGSGLLAYEVGLGKTPSAIMTIKHYLEAGWCKRPFLVVPRSTYKTWLREIRQLLPVEIMKINEFSNMTEDIVNGQKDINKKIKMVDEGSISIFTFEGFKRLAFLESTLWEVAEELENVLYQYDPEASEKEREKKGEKIMTLMGKSQAKTSVAIEDLGFDFMCVDEAHNMKKVFTSVKAKAKSNKQYDISTGKGSTIGLKGFCISQYIQKMNGGHNVMLLTATPFTNSPLEVYSMLSLISYEELKRLNLSNLNDFFDMFCLTSYELKINAKMIPERKMEPVGWNNLQALQKIVFRFMNYKAGDNPDEKGRGVRLDRPEKYILPYEKVIVDGLLTALPEDQVILTSLSLTEHQKLLMGEIREYVIHNILPREPNADFVEEEEEEISSTPEADNLEEGSKKEDKIDKQIPVGLDYSNLKDDEKAGVRVLQGVGWSRSLAVSPYLYRYSGLGIPQDYLEFVETSPKLMYTIQCIASIKKYHERKNEPVSGVIVYMDRGKDYMGFLKEYLVKEIGYKEHEIGIIIGATKDRATIQNLFNGEEYNEASGEMLPIDDDRRIKVILGSRAIREGMNLQKKASTLINCYVDWNPSDQEQLSGRIWRQKNQFKAIRIVFPLMIDSMDIFMFQKLEVKTQRINQIWNRDGQTSVIEVDKLDPKEQKMSLITDPRILAEMEVDKASELLTEDKSGMTQLQDTLSQIKTTMMHVADRRKKFEEIATQFRPVKPDKKGNIRVRSDSAIISAIEQIAKEQTDAEGVSFEDVKYKGYGDYSTGSRYVYYNSFHVPDNFADYRIAVRQLAKKEETLLKGLGIELNQEDLTAYIRKLNEDITRIDEDIKNLTGKDAMSHRIERIREEQEARNLGHVKPEQRVKEFEKLNYLLSQVAFKDAEQVAFESLIDPNVCPPKSEDGTRRIDKEALVQLNYCVERLPQTKALNIISDGAYTEKRKKLHESIIFGLYKNIACLHHDQPIAVLTAGPPGSGKSYFLKQFAPYMQSNRIIKIDADAIREKLPEYAGWNASATHEETKNIVSEALSYISTPCRHDVLYDGTMNTPKNYEPLIGKLRDLGYKIYIVFVDVPKDYAIKRVLERYQHTGRYVPLSVVDEFYSHASNHFDHIKTLVDGWMEVDGETAEIKYPIHGEPIPQDREYFTQDTSTLPKEPEKLKEVVDEAINKAEIREIIDGLEIALEGLEGEERESLQEIIDGLLIAIE
jgi:predicted ABC-type ATPase